LNIAVAPVRIGGQTMRLLVDTGSDRLVLLGGNVAEVRPLALRTTSESATSLIDRRLQVQEFSAPDIILGEHHFCKDQAYLVPEASDPVFDGLLGVRALGFRTLSYDQPHRTIYLQK